MSKISEKLKDKLVTKPGRTVTEVAELLGITRPALSNVLNGNAGLSLELAIRIEKTFGLNGRTLLIMQLEENMADVRAGMEG